MNRIVRITSDGIEIEADKRHADLLVRDLGLANAKAVDTPRVKHAESEIWKGVESPKLDKVQTTQYRSCVMRASYMGQDRPDIQEAVKCLAQYMKNPNEYAMTELKRLGRYLAGRPRVVLKFPKQSIPKALDAWVDGDHAGDIVTRKSTSGMMIFYGKHLPKSSSTVQSTIALNVGESEFYAAVKGSAHALGIRSLLRDWGVGADIKLNVRTDCAAAKGFATRRGLGKQRHVNTRFLWLQDRVARGDVAIVKVRTAEQLADPLTKAMQGPARLPLLLRAGLEFRSGSANTQKGLTG